MDSETENKNSDRYTEERLTKLELFSHPPQKWEKRIEALEKFCIKIYDGLQELKKNNKGE
tara:strand:+ start:817 stop:996 length:180 start_codon:yes stop_codon:yes gene_type:complete